MKKHYHYTGCGLDYIYLASGFRVHDTPYGRGVSIEKADELHEAIALDVIGRPNRLRGQEVRFLRAQLDASQSGLARILGVTRAAVARWEAEPKKYIPGAADRALRMFYALKVCGRKAASRVLEVLDEIDDLKLKPEVFEAADGEWTRAAA